MTPEDKVYFEEIIVKAVQSTKQENSGLVALILHRLEKELEPIVNKLVNGKINHLTEMQIQQNAVLESIKATVSLLTKETEPLIQKNKESTILHKYVGNFGATIIRVSAVLSAASFIVLGIISLVKFLK